MKTSVNSRLKSGIKKRNYFVKKKSGKKEIFSAALKLVHHFISTIFVVVEIRFTFKWMDIIDSYHSYRRE